MRLIALIAAAAMFVMPTVAQSQWVWRDKNKQVHASDLPPPRDIPDRDVIQRPSAPAPRAAAASAPQPASAASANVAPDGKTAGVDPELEARRKKAADEQAAQRKTEEAQNARERRAACDAARANLRQLESGIRIARVNEKGERIILDDATREQEIRRARAVASETCR